MKKVLITLAIVGGISLIGIASVSALSNNHHANYSYNKNSITATNCPNCGNYIDTNNDGVCDNCTNHHVSTSYNQHYEQHHRHGHN